MSLANEKLRQLVELLFEATTMNSLEWDLGDNEIPSAIINDNAISLRKSRNADGEDLYIYEVYDENGQLVERFDDEQLNGAREPNVEMQNWFTLSRAVHELAMRKASKSDAVIDSIISVLSEKIIPF